MAEEGSVEKEQKQIEVDVRETLRRFTVEEAVIAGGVFLIFISLLLPGLGVGLRVAVGIMFLLLAGTLIGRATRILGPQLASLCYCGAGVVTLLLGITALGVIGGFGAVFSLVGGVVVAGIGFARLFGLKHPLVERLDERLLKEEGQEAAGEGVQEGQDEEKQK